MEQQNVCKKNRKANWSHSEVKVLLTKMLEHRDLLLNSNMTNSMKRKKSIAWAIISNKVREVNSVPRTSDDLRKKWRDLKMAAFNYRKKIKATGQRDKVEIPQYYDRVMGIVGNNGEPSLDKGGEDSHITTDDPSSQPQEPVLQLSISPENDKKLHKPWSDLHATKAEMVVSGFEDFPNDNDFAASITLPETTLDDSIAYREQKRQRKRKAEAEEQDVMVTFWRESTKVQILEQRKLELEIAEKEKTAALNQRLLELQIKKLEKELGE